MLKVLNIHTYYGDSHVLQGINLDVAKGTVVALLGRNGVGKTTLVRSIVGFTPPRRGQVLFNDVEITRMPAYQIGRMQIGLVPQGRRIFPSLTVQENLAIALRNSIGNPWDLPRILGLFPALKERCKNKGNELSGGEQQMLAIARALVSNPVLLLMDEPTEGLAPALVREVAKLILRLKEEGMTILLIEQNIALAAKVADEAHVMSKGQIVYSSSPRELWENQEIKTRFLGVPTNT